MKAGNAARGVARTMWTDTPNAGISCGPGSSAGLPRASFRGWGGVEPPGRTDGRFR